VGSVELRRAAGGGAAVGGASTGGVLPPAAARAGDGAEPDTDGVCAVGAGGWAGGIWEFVTAGGGVWRGGAEAE